MEDSQRNAVFEKFWPSLRLVVYRIWMTHPTVRRIGSVEDVENEAALAVLSAIPNFRPAETYESEAKADGHVKAYLVSVIHRCLIYRSRCASLVHVPAHVAADVFDGKELPARSAVHCRQLDGMQLQMSRPAGGKEEYTVGDLMTAISRLQPRERDIIQKFWGLEGDRVSLGAIARKYRLTRNAARRRVRAIESKLRLIMNRD